MRFSNLSSDIVICDLRVVSVYKNAHRYDEVIIDDNSTD